MWKFVSTQDWMEYFGWDVLNHPPYDPDLTPSDFHLFSCIKIGLGGKHFDNDEVKSAVKVWLSEQAKNVIEKGFQHLIARYDESPRA